METELRARPISVKSTNDDDGTFEALVSVFGNRDFYGDVMVKGAFARTIGEWKADGGEIPFLWSHASEDPMAYVAGITEAEETEQGLVVRGRFDLDTDQSRQAYKLLKSRRIKEFSFGFLVREYEFGEQDGQEVRFVKDVDLLEASMTMLGANPQTRLLAIKSTPKQGPLGNITAEELTAMVTEAVKTALTEAGEGNSAPDSGILGSAENGTAAASPEPAADETPEGKSASLDQAAAAIDQLSIRVTSLLIEE